MKNRILTFNNTFLSGTLFALTLLLATVAGCGGSNGPTDAERITAAQKTVENNTNCTALSSPDGFYWEIGDQNGTLASGPVGPTYTSTTSMDIASASKLIFGAYVVERFKSDLSQANSKAMRMESGYVSFDYTACKTATNSNPSTTVHDCFTASHGLSKHNNDYTVDALDKFDYNGGHFQFYADGGLNLADLTKDTLTTEIKDQLGQELNIAYGSPQLAAGVHLTPADYAQFLRKILSGGLAIREHLGEDPVCTLKTVCPTTAIYSPAEPYAWHYSWGHWIEDDTSIGDDGAFSSPGAFGFYPWIDASKKYYGILARRENVIDVIEGGQPYKDSAMCGRLIRAAFLTGVEQ